MGEDFPVEVPEERADEFKRYVKILAAKMNAQSEQPTEPKKYKRLSR